MTLFPDHQELVERVKNLEDTVRKLFDITETINGTLCQAASVDKSLLDSIVMLNQKINAIETALGFEVPDE